MQFLRRNVRGSVLLETLIAVALFAAAMSVMSLVIYPFLAGAGQQTVEPHLARARLESLSRAMDVDFGKYAPIYAFEGEVKNDDGWILPNEESVDLSSGTLADVAKDPVTFLARAESAMGWSVTANTSNRQAWTLLFLGENGNIEIAYHMYATDSGGGGITYSVERFDLNGRSHRSAFIIPGFTLASPDQSLPYFKQAGNNLIEIQFPNPFSTSILNPLSYGITYKSPLLLKYYLTNLGSS